jgi:hypothetical protein
MIQVRYAICQGNREWTRSWQKRFMTWPEHESPYRMVAHLLLPRQEIARLQQQDAYRNLSFNVWPALTVHRPLGGINRVRCRAYALSCDWYRADVGVNPPRHGSESKRRE